MMFFSTSEEKKNKNCNQACTFVLFFIQWKDGRQNVITPKPEDYILTLRPEMWS